MIILDTRVYIYYSFLVTCFLISLFNFKNDKGLKLICILLFFSVVTDGLAISFKLWNINKSNHYILYHFFTPLEYSLLAGYYYLNTHNFFVKKMLLTSIVTFIIISTIISYKFIETGKYPSLNNQICYVLIICFSILTLLNLEPQGKEKLRYKALFWIAIGFTIYCTGVFFFNSLYNYLKQHYPVVAKDTFNLINSIFNDVLYTLISIGLICSKKTKKYSHQ